MTAKARREEREARAGDYFQKEFRPALSAALTVAAARALANAAIAEDHPGRAFHERLEFFVTRWDVPSGSSLAERLALMTLARRLESAGELTLEELAAIEERFRRASPPPR